MQRSSDFTPGVRARGPNSRHLGVELLERRALLTVPTVLAIQPVAANALTNQEFAQYLVTFSESVTGVSSSDFALVTTGGVAADRAIEISGTGDQYLAVVHGIQGAGTLRLDLVDNDSITGALGDPLGGPGAGNGNVSGQPYTIDQRAPFVQSINRSIPSTTSTGAHSVVFAVTFSEAVANVGPSDFQVVTNGAASASPVVAIAGSGATYSVTVNQVNGTGGTLALRLVDDGSIRDLAGNQLTTAAAPITFSPQVTFPTGVVPIGVTSTEVNGDGFADALVANFVDNTVSVLLGNGNGSFQPQTTVGVGINPSSVAAADLNNDLKPDLVVTNFGSDTLGILFGNGDGTFQPQLTLAVGSHPQSAAIADFNDDAHPDIVVANFAGGTLSVLLGDGMGGLQLQPLLTTGTSPQSVRAADFNLDGKVDLAVANFGTNDVSIFFGNGDGTFQQQPAQPVGTKPRGLVAVDVNADGRPDLVVTNSGDNTVSVLLATASGSFVSPVNYPTGASPWGVAVADVNGDGKRDLVIGNSGDDTVSVLRGNGNGTFMPQLTFSTGGNPQALTVADLNQDSKPDLLVANFLDANVSVLTGSAQGGFTGQSYTIESATQLAFAALPVSTLVGNSIGTVKVSALDRLNRVVTQDTSTVTLRLVGGVFNTGTDTVQAPLVSGTATFSGLSITNGGAYTLEASASGLIKTSPAFNIYSSVLNRQLFYKGSPRYNVTNSNFPGFSDDNAIATDKVALLPGAGAATFANVSSYSGGITGLMVDLLGGVGVTAADFSFRVGNDNAPANWSAGPSPSTVLVRPGAGVGGSDRIELIWPAGAIRKTWLEVTVAASSHTHLAAPDVFYFGDAVGDSGLGDTSTQAIVDLVDEDGARTHPQYLFQNIPITNIYDFDRDGAVGANDQLIAHNNYTSPSTALNYLSAPGVASVADRKLFYRGSSRYDTTSLLFPGFSDDNAIATDKVALLPGTGVATFDNLSSYSGGITGIMVDLLGPGAHGSLTAADFAFKVGNSNYPSMWWAGPPPTSVVVRPGAGTAGADRVELIWPAGAITKTWLEVIVLATPRTGLPQSSVLPDGQADVFFFGNALGDSGLGNTSTLAKVDGNDELAARNNPQLLFNNIPITNPYDYNRDGMVDGNDELIARNNPTTVTSALKFLNFSNPPAAPSGAQAAAITAAPLVTSQAEDDPTAVPPLQQPPSALLAAPKSIRSLARGFVFEHLTLDADWQDFE
jgi:hypothetical protein